MTTATRILLVRSRTCSEPLAMPAPLGVLLKKADGWHFNPLVAGRKSSRKGQPTWEKAIPRWTGGLDATESRRMENCETIADVLDRFTGVLPQKAAGTR